MAIQDFDFVRGCMFGLGVIEKLAQEAELTEIERHYHAALARIVNADDRVGLHCMPDSSNVWRTAHSALFSQIENAPPGTTHF